MGVSVSHILTATTPDNTSYEIRPSHWNSAHSVSIDPLFISAGTNSQSIGTVQFSNTNGVSFGMDTGGVVTASVSKSAGFYGVGNTTGQSSSSTMDVRSLSFDGAGAISVGLSAGSMVISAPNTVALTQFSGGISTGGNTSGNSGVVTAQLVLAGGNNVTLSGSTNAGSATVTISAPNAQSGISSVAASGGTQTAGMLSFINSNGLTFGMSTGAVTGSVTASYTVPTVTNSSWTVSDANTSATVGRLAFTNSNGLTLSLSTSNNGNHTVIGSYTVPTQTNQTLSIVATSNTAGNTSGVTVDARSLTLDGFGIASIGFSTSAGGTSIVVSATQSNQAVSAQGGSSTFQTLSFTNSNNVSFSNTGGSIWGSYALNVSAGAGTSNPLSAITFANSNGLTFGLSTGAGVGTMTASYNSTSAVGPNTAQTNVTWTVNSSGISINAGGYAGTTTAITGLASITLNTAGLNFNGSSLLGANTAQTNVTWTVNSSGISLNAAGYAGTGGTTGTTTGAATFTQNTAGLSVVYPYYTKFLWPGDLQLTAVTAPGNASQTIQYVVAPVALTGSRLDALLAMSNSSSAGAGTVTLQFSQYAIIYTRNVSTLSSLSSGSTQTTYTYASNTAGATYLTNSAIYPISVPINFNMPPGEYYVGFNMVTAATAASATMSMMGANDLQTAVNYAEFANTATSTNLYGGMGIYSAATTGVVTRVSLSAINQTGSAISAANIGFVFRNG